MTRRSCKLPKGACTVVNESASLDSTVQNLQEKSLSVVEACVFVPFLTKWSLLSCKTVRLASAAIIFDLVMLSSMQTPRSCYACSACVVLQSYSHCKCHLQQIVERNSDYID